MLMPGRSYSGPLPPLSPPERALAADLESHVRMLSEAIGERHTRRPDALETAAGYIEGRLQAFGLTTAAQEFVADGVTVRNIEAEIRGTTRPEEIIVVGGHYDSVPDCPAADDNATGVAAVLEIARLAAECITRPEPSKPGSGTVRGAGNPFTRRPERTLRLVAFVNEEPPFFHTELMGSLVYARRCKARGENITGMISLETIGCYSDRPGSQAYPLPPPLDRLFPDVGNFIAFVGDLGALGYVRHWVGSFRRLVKFPSEGVAAPELIAGVGWSDHWSFRQVGYPALMITDTAPFRYPYYHTRDDTADKIDFRRTARVVAGVARVTAQDVGAAVADFEP